MTGILLDLGPLSRQNSSVAKYVARERVVTMVAIIVNVFPRPISSARIPPSMSFGTWLLEPVILCRNLITKLANCLNNRRFVIRDKYSVRTLNRPRQDDQHAIALPDFVSHLTHGKPQNRPLSFGGPTEGLVFVQMTFDSINLP